MPSLSSPFRKALFAAIVALAWSPLAQAASVDVFFTGARPVSDPDTAFGISLASAQNARDNFGVPILDRVDVLSTITGKVSVISQALGAVTPNPPTSSLNRATSTWGVRNVSASTLQGASYLLFTHTDPFTQNGTPINYPDENVGIRIDRDLGWVIIKARSGGIDYYYPALLLDSAANSPAGRSLAAGEQVSISIDYVVSRSLILAGSNYVLPEYQIGFAQVIPEPGTALLFGLGLVGLAAGGRKRVSES